jgi:hypothetical protein
LNCPYCGRRLAVRISERDIGPQWMCQVHGEFRIDVTGRLRDVPRADAFYSPNYRPPPRDPKPGEPLWSLQKDEHTWSAELRDHGAGVGVEVQILCDGELVSGRRFDLRELATRWAEQERQAIERWQLK